MGESAQPSGGISPGVPLTIIQVHEKSQRLTSGQAPEIENLLSKK